MPNSQQCIQMWNPSCSGVRTQHTSTGLLLNWSPLVEVNLCRVIVGFTLN
uniref:SDP6 n=1 Tax=Arundo donax TaxID=35708 RepID=A0A0A9HD02_ARUDO